MSLKILYNDKFLEGTLGPNTEMLGPIGDSGIIIYNTAPGCWGPMITPRIRDGHECNIPVAIEDAMVGDSVLIKIKKILVTSKASSSGTHEFIEEKNEKCPNCDVVWPEVYVDGTGLEFIKCAKCGAPASPYVMTNGYTMVFDDNRKVGLTVNSEIAEAISKEASKVVFISGSELRSLFDKDAHFGYEIMNGLIRVIGARVRNIEQLLVTGRRSPFFERPKSV